MARATVRSLSGESYEGFELSVSATDANGLSKLLRQAARVVKERQALGVTLNGPHWRESNDTMVLGLVLSEDRYLPHRSRDLEGCRQPSFRPIAICGEDIR